MRRWLEPELRAALPRTDASNFLIGDALLIATELVTNAVHARCTQGRVSWELEPGCLQLFVFDNAPGWPVIQHPEPTDTHGRGLQIIDALAADRGTRTVHDGKLAWAALHLPTVSGMSA